MKMNGTTIVEKITDDLDETVSGIFELWANAGYQTGAKGLIFAAIERYKKTANKDELPEWMMDGDSHTQTEDVWAGIADMMDSLD